MSEEENKEESKQNDIISDKDEELLKNLSINNIDESYKDNPKKNEDEKNNKYIK